uniref:Glycerol-3-phosphate acyltransferase n=1 Tax=Fervidobacterium nodosum TaxID=2424 RepID=A0A7C5U613_9BACT
MYYFLIIAIQFLSGSVMYSSILAKIKGVDLRKVRDGNPGSTNLWRAAGFKWGFSALALDYFKGLLPLALFAWKNRVLNPDINPYVVSIAALAGIAGHAFSPFLKFKGGKAVATTFGAWSVLTMWEGPTLLGGVFTIFSIINKFKGKKKTTPEDDALRVFVGFFILFFYTLWKVINGRFELLILYFGNLAIIAYKHRFEIKRLIVRSVKNEI